MADNSDTVSIGLGNLDVLLTTDGIPIGQMGTLISTPESSSYRLLLQMAMDDPSETVYFTNNHNDKKISGDMSSIFENDSTADVVNIRHMPADDIVSKINDIDFENTSVVIVDSIDDIDGIGDSNTLNELRDISREGDIVILLHQIETEAGGDFSFDSVDLTYMSDFLFGISKSRVEQSIRQRFMIYRIPNRSELDTTQNDSGVVEIEYLKTNLAVDSGERI